MPLRAIAWAAIALGCAPAAPLLSGGRTVPRGRSELALGSAFRVPVGDMAPELAPEDQAIAYGAPGGVAPLGSVRHGVDRNIDLGVDVVGTTIRGQVRGRIPIGGGAALVLGAAPGLGVLSASAISLRAGALGSAVIAIDISSLYEAWIGARVGLEHLAGEGVGLSGLRTGGVVGLAAGFRRFHVLVELAVDHEYWWGHYGDSPIELNGAVLTPAFALRLRL